MPYQALFSHVPDLAGLQCWGMTVLVHIGNSSKLNACVCKGCWLSFNAESHAH